MPEGSMFGPSERRQFPTPFRTMAHVIVALGQADSTILEIGQPAGQGQPPHIHDEYDEAFPVIAGEVIFQLGDIDTTASAGTTVFAPRGTTRGFANRSNQQAKMLVIATPRALEFVESLGRLAAANPPDPRAIRELYMAHHTRLTADYPLQGPMT
jgi:quercetin dioxygenase-like cupin family protein